MKRIAVFVKGQKFKAERLRQLNLLCAHRSKWGYKKFHIQGQKDWKWLLQTHLTYKNLNHFFCKASRSI